MPGTKASLLVVDDKSSVRAQISHMLAEIGHSVRSAQDGFSALRDATHRCLAILVRCHIRRMDPPIFMAATICGTSNPQ
jgi:CheY-like chemotaxis protein